MSLCVTIPKNDYYSLFADGLFICKHSFEEFHHIFFDKNAVLILFYHFPCHRRVYITAPLSARDNKYVYSLEGVDSKRCVLATLHGRAFDRLKMSLDVIKKETDYNCFSYPNAFWIKIIYLMQQGKNSYHNIVTLINIFKEIA